MNNISGNYMKTFKTRDLQLASTLKCMGHHILGMEKHHDGRSLIFIFEDPDNAVRKHEEDYVGQRLRVEPRELFSTTSTLKSWVDQKKQLEIQNNITIKNDEGNKEKAK